METTSIDRRIDSAICQAGIYSIASKLLWTPLALDLISEYRDGFTLEYLHEYLRNIESRHAKAAVELRTWLLDAPAQDREIAINVESTALFRSKYPSIAAPPYESFWLSGDGLLLGAPAIEVSRAYAAAGVIVAPDSPDFCPDHVARELEFLAYLCSSEAAALEKGDAQTADERNQTRRRFVSEHAIRWMPQFFTAVRENATLPFFQLVADVVEDTLHRSVDDAARA